ncbi:protoporphyrinogen oxidase [Paenibacillus antri]|uniref:Coproporphyrinogen III oxidase n=1 Tax=Paenibacillus antri TaxID=2582848 RepID=A0A5R9GGG5_9BACL|nr:protoporphyrinogen oxidase [Paenibacillus antri]TLS53516.1 protoporphyrinogen oxidase [Paenibacillus antri]
MENERGKADPHLVVIGGGITGLTTAFYAIRQAKAEGLGLKVTLIEGSERLGGKIRTMRRDGFVIERGPDSFLARKRPIIDLSRELGLAEELVTLNPATKKTYILRGGKLHRIPPGLVLGVPTEWKPFVTSGLIGLSGKLRAALDWVLPAARGDADESLGGFLRRRLGDQVVDFVAEPLLSGIYAGDADKLSLLATFPQFRAAERKYRSLMIGLGRGAGATRSGAAGEDHIPPHARGSAFLSYRRGLSALVERLSETLQAEGAVLLTGEPVRAVTPERGGGAVVTLANGDALLADAVAVTTPVSALGELLQGVPEASLFRDMAYASVANVVLGYRRDAIRVPLDGAGFVIPRTEGRFITACTWTSEKWLHTAPRENVLIRCYVGRIDDERWRTMDDAALGAAVKREVAELIGIDVEPEFLDITRLEKSMPQYEVGHLDKVRALRDALMKKAPGVFAAGAGFEGVGLPDCIHQGKQAAEQAVAFTRRRSEA